MRERFTRVVADALDHDPRVALVLADIGVSRFEELGAAARHPSASSTWASASSC